jgi:NADH-quinone oxidoreductase subunit M
MIMAAFAGCGLPGFANFAGEVTVFFGAWKVFPRVTVLACWGTLIIGAIYLLRAVRNILHGPSSNKWNELADAANPLRKAPFVLLVACLFIFGCFPRLLTEKIQPRAQEIVDALNRRPETIPSKVPVIQAAMEKSTNPE